MKILVSEEMIEAFLDVWTGGKAWRKWSGKTKRKFRDQALPALQAAMRVYVEGR